MIHIHCNTEPSQEKLCCEVADRHGLRDASSLVSEGLDFETPNLGTAIDFLKVLGDLGISTYHQVEPDEHTLTFTGYDVLAKSILQAADFSVENLDFGAIQVHSIKRAKIARALLKPHTYNLQGGVSSETPTLVFAAVPDKILAIKALRENTGWGLMEAKECIEAGEIPVGSMERALVLIEKFKERIPGIHLYDEVKDTSNERIYRRENFRPEPFKVSTKYEVERTMSDLLGALCRINVTTNTLLFYGHVPENVVQKVVACYRTLGVTVDEARVPNPKEN